MKNGLLRLGFGTFALKTARMSVTVHEIVAAFKQLQNEICSALSEYDGSTFLEDLWERPGGGGGRTRVIKGSKIEKGGVNFSEVHGILEEKGAAALGIVPGAFLATGVSIVLHPQNPWVPIIHMNVRYFESGDGSWWFGGGIDLTPHYVMAEDAVFFHTQMKAVCDRFDLDAYAKYKPWADEYFYIKHRQETRGIGGIFFDRLGVDAGRSKEDIFNFVLEVGRSFAPTYLHIAKKQVEKPFSEANKQWQYLRRGRYAEFNLAIDRGTRFGLETDGRTESILMSLPPMATWEYQHIPETDSLEAKTLQLLKKGINWIPQS